MIATLRAVAVGLSTLVVACSSGAGAEPRVVGVGGSAPRAALSAEAGSAEIPPLTEEELRRLLDALEQEIDDR